MIQLELSDHSPNLVIEHVLAIYCTSEGKSCWTSHCHSIQDFLGIIPNANRTLYILDSKGYSSVGDTSDVLRLILCKCCTNKNNTNCNVGTKVVFFTCSGRYNNITYKSYVTDKIIGREQLESETSGGS